MPALERHLVLATDAKSAARAGPRLALNRRSGRSRAAPSGAHLHDGGAVVGHRHRALRVHQLIHAARAQRGAHLAQGAGKHGERAA